MRWVGQLLSLSNPKTPVSWVPAALRRPEGHDTNTLLQVLTESSRRGKEGVMTVSGACLYLYHFGPAAKAHVLADEHQAGAGGQLLRYYKALSWLSEMVTSTMPSPRGASCWLQVSSSSGSLCRSTIVGSEAAGVREGLDETPHCD